MTPLKWLGHLYSFWRGDLIFRFVFICSKYHKGRVIFSWDPDFNIASSAGSATTNFSRLVDISVEPDIEIRCNYMQATSYLRIQDDRTKTNLVFGAGALANHEATYDNGILTCRVFTEQTSPVSSADIQIMVFVRGADNFEYAAPQELSYDYSLYTTQGGSEEWQIQGDELEYGAPPEVALAASGTGSDDLHKNLVYMGETMKSLRQLIRRTSLSRVSNLATNSTDRFISLNCTRSRYPLSYGFDPKGVDTANEIIGASTAPFNFVTQHPLNWVRMCYLGTRGSIRWQFNFEGANIVSNFRARRTFSTRVAADYDKYETCGTLLTQKQVTRLMTIYHYKAGSSGQSVTNQLTQTGLSVEFPMYSRFRMMSNNAYDITEGYANDESADDSIVVNGNVSPLIDTVKNNPRNTLLYSYCSAGTDFTCLYFMNVPTMYFYSSIPTAV
jgi:hypothetical protein